MSSDQSTVLMSWAKVSIRMVTEKTYVAEGRVSTIRVRSKIACSVGCPPQLVELSGTFHFDEHGYARDKYDT